MLVWTSIRIPLFALAEGKRGGEVRFYGTIENRVSPLDSVIRKLQSGGKRHLEFVYEAGPCGYGIYRHLVSKGFECMVVASSRIPRARGNRIKTDRRDAKRLARLLRAGDLTPIYVPNEEDEAMRDLTRARSSSRPLLGNCRRSCGRSPNRCRSTETGVTIHECSGGSGITPPVRGTPGALRPRGRFPENGPHR